MLAEIHLRSPSVDAGSSTIEYELHEKALLRFYMDQRVYTCQFDFTRLYREFVYTYRKTHERVECRLKFIEFSQLSHRNF